jgi:hypothetical protein
VREHARLAALASIHKLLEAAGIEYRLFGPWEVDSHVGKVT